ncbi:nucleoside-diphosphate-sugar epimerases [Sulfuriferula multivorans]|uniref:Nucleoside-diphosphate-sugar epimerases n=1 Tax=Sulfuriferula multivorans TaxID=1559896 RepID=A0A401JBC6_9PROT|nr:SDR family oxidoreductase [Sulfuriferula multivorans]GBL44909.1 nucleoside-diphosphate-sugar epimerases [Sulfuriferula multivorans]
MANILIIGCGDVGLRTARLLAPQHRLYALARTPQSAQHLREAGITPIPGDLDDRASLTRLAGIADWVLHFAPPPAHGVHDMRTRKLLSMLGKSRILPRRLVYISTSGVYGDCAGALIDETRPPRPQNVRARRRLDAEQQVRRWGRRNGVATSILRVPGIYAGGRLPIERLQRGTPVLCAEDDVFTNHIHADDLAQIAVHALFRARAGRVFHASDDSQLCMGDYFVRVAAAFDLPAPPRVTRAEAESTLPAQLLSFMRESRRMANRRIKSELNVHLAYPDIDAFLKTQRPAG